MNKTFIFATSPSRLSADLLIIRLKRVGISTSTISALFPSKSRPNSALCWLGACLTSTGWRNEDMSLTVAGPLRRYFGGKQADRGVADRLVGTGLADESARQLEEKLRQGEIVVCIQAENERQMSLAWHVCYQMNTESLLVSSAQHEATVKHRPRPRRSVFRSPSFATALLSSPSWAGAPA